MYRSPLPLMKDIVMKSHFQEITPFQTASLKKKRFLLNTAIKTTSALEKSHPK